MLLTDIIKGYRLILASQSPRRRMILEGLDLPFEVVVREDVKEDSPSNLGMFGLPEYLARIKSDYYTDLLTDMTILITADTVVWHRNKVIGKPESIKDAMSMITKLSGNMHEVITGVCLRSASKIRIFHSHSKVWFRKLTEEEIDYYVTHYNPIDKAGAYGIQEWIGYIGIDKIEGSFYNVMGLPVQMLYLELLDFIS